jgi:molybdopterin-binding protein
MNTLSGEIESIIVKNTLSLVYVQVASSRLCAIVIDTPETASYLKTGQPIKVIFKETEVIIGTGKEHQISLQNKLTGPVLKVESGELLSKVTIDTPAGAIVSIITTNAVKQLQIEAGIEVTAMIKTNEVMLSP